MNVIATESGVRACFGRRGVVDVSLSEIETIGIEVIGSLPVDLDLLSLNCENGEYLEFTDDAEGFPDILDHLSRELRITPPIAERFLDVILDADPVYVYFKDGKNSGRTSRCIRPLTVPTRGAGFRERPF